MSCYSNLLSLFYNACKKVMSSKKKRLVHDSTKFDQKIKTLSFQFENVTQ